MLALVLGAAVAIVGFHSHAHSHGELTVRDARGTTVTIGDWRLGNTPGQVPAVLSAGAMELWLANTDGVAHDLVVARAAEPGSLAVQDGRGAIERIGEVLASSEAFDPGEEATLSFALEPGRYVLFCNQTGHYQRGMYYSFEVQ
jgi:uncharacterized cupredoxin-like copper-binding protein